MPQELQEVGEPFGDKIRRMLDEAKRTQADVADAAELAPAVVSRIMSSERPPRMEHILALARALEVSPGTLVLGTSASSVLGEWVPRTQLDAEAKCRAEAQRELDVARSKLAEREGRLRSLDLRRKAEHVGIAADPGGRGGRFRAISAEFVRSDEIVRWLSTS